MRVATDIDRSVAAVWGWYAVDHIRNHPRWDADMELHQVSDGPMGLGTRIRRRNRHLDRAVEGEMEIVAWEPEQLFGTRIRDENMDTEARVTFEALTKDRTRLSIEADFVGIDVPTGDRIRLLMERSARTIRELIEADLKP